jgi:hypothetical protein
MPRDECRNTEAATQPQKRKLDAAMEGICTFVVNSKRRRKAAQFTYTEAGVLEKNQVGAAPLQLPQLHVPLCELIDPGHSDTCPPLHQHAIKPNISEADRKRLTVILARSLLYLYGSPWIQHSFSLEKLFICTTDLASLNGQHPYLHCSIPVHEDPDQTEEPHQDIWAHPHVIAFGLRLLEIESGSLIAPEEEDRDLEFDRIAPYYTLDRALQGLQGDGRRVEDPYLNVAESCLNFDDKLTSITVPTLSPEQNYRLAIYKFIVTPLLEQLIQRFSGHALDLLEVARAPPDQSQVAVPVTKKTPVVRVKEFEEPHSRGMSPFPRNGWKNRHWEHERLPHRPAHEATMGGEALRDHVQPRNGHLEKKARSLDVAVTVGKQMRMQASSCVSLALSIPEVKPEPKPKPLLKTMALVPGSKRRGITLFHEETGVVNEADKYVLPSPQRPVQWTASF